MPRAHRRQRWRLVPPAGGHAARGLPVRAARMISAAMLALGPALGETIAVALILSALFTINWHITEPGGNTFAANIALQVERGRTDGLSALVASAWCCSSSPWPST